MKIMLLAFCLGVILNAADDATLPAGKKAEQQACVACHSTRIIESQRLSPAAWKKEMAKMIGWGAVVPNQEILLDYLTTEFNDSKPVPSPEHSKSK
jgi:mono/diheme cytochrome c family protein